MNDTYKRKVELLLRILPFVTDEECFAIHGGTAINLFLNNLPRLSIDIDVTYIPLEEREASISKVNDALKRISQRVTRQFKDIRVIPRYDICKITCESRGCQVKIEVNKTKRGLIGGEAKIYPLCEKASELFGVEVDARIVSIPQLYGGKIAAALSRQHPRDLFDVNQMKYTLDEIKEGIIFNLLGSDRPIFESFEPNLIDQRNTMENQFVGMTDIPFDYNQFENTRDKLISDVKNLMDREDKEFLISFEENKANWDEYSYGNLKEYPSVTWKMRNLENLERLNPSKLIYGANRLREIFDIK